MAARLIGSRLVALTSAGLRPRVAGMTDLGKAMGKYSSGTVAACVRRARAGGWKELDAGGSAVRDEDLRQLAREDGAEGLESLHLWRCQEITDAGVKALAEGCPRLAQLDLSGPRHITDAGVKALAEGCPSLAKLHLTFCEKITDASLKALAEGCPSLAKLDLFRCEKITNAGVKALAEGCPRLAELYLAMCEKITDGGVRALAKGCPRVADLDLSGCEKITVGGLALLEDILPPDGNLRWLHVSGIAQLGLPEEVIEGADARRIVTAAQEIVAGTTEPLLEVKIVVLGDGLAGKTQLCNRLRGEPYQEECDRTQDFEVHALPLDQLGPEDEDVVARLFDFGGQPHLWSAHRFFLASQRNLYVVVIDGTRQKVEDLDYWLRYIRHYAAQNGAREGPRTSANRPPQAQERMDIPVLAVVSKCDQGSFRELSRLAKEVLQDWPGLRVVARYSSKTDDGLPQVMSDLREMVTGMDYVFTAQYPKAMDKVKRWLEGSEEARQELETPEFARSITTEEFVEVCARADANGDHALWLPVLRNLGVALWVGDLPQVDPGTPLAQRLYHPQWVKTLTYGIIRHGLENALPHVIGDGELLKLMAETWRQAREREPKRCTGTLDDGEKRQMIDLMHACRLVFRGTAQRRKHWLVLDWIPDTRGVVTGMLRDESSRVTFPEFLPESFLVRFAGRWFNENTGLGDSLHRDQIVVIDPAYPDVQAVVRADRATRRLFIRTHGGTADERTDVDGKVRGVTERLADEEGLLWQEECWVQMAAERTEDMDYYLYPPFFVIGPQTSFPDAWEVFCCEVLNLANATDRIRRLGAPDEGVDLLWDERGIAYQCKSVESGKAGDFKVTEAIKSLRQAIEHRDQIGWREYWICTNVDVTGSQEKKLRDVLPDVKLQTPSFWIPCCGEYHQHVYRRFRVLAPMKGQQPRLLGRPGRV